MGTTTDTRSDDVSNDLSRQLESFRSRGQEEEEEAKKTRIRLLRGRRSNLLDTFNNPSNTLGG